LQNCTKRKNHELKWLKTERKPCVFVREEERVW
jgi:hypothetical protein